MNGYRAWDTYIMPTSIEQALALLIEHGPHVKIIAGGTDLLVELRREPRPDLALVDVTRIGDLDRVYVDGKGMVHIGPGVTHNQAVASSLLVERGLPLVTASWLVGTPALRNRGTIAGNLVTASPANDTITPLCALGARLTLRSVRGERVLPLLEFYQGVRQTALAPDEMVVDIAFPSLGEDRRGAFAKLGLRRTHAIAVVNVAAVLTFDGSAVTEARISLGSVAPTIIRAPEAERALTGGPLSDERIAEAADLAARAAAPIDDLRAGAGYRRTTVRALVRRVLVALSGRPGAAQIAVLPADPPMLWGRTDGRFAPLTGTPLTHSPDRASTVAFTVNGRRVAVEGASGKTLLAVLRDDLGLTGSKEGCGEGECGACTVWMDGIAVLACLVPAPRAHGTEIVTVEGLAKGERLHPVQQAFLDEGAVQCGYCTPGFVMSGANLLDEIPHPSREQIAAGLSGNLCRCTGYYKIVRALERAADRGS
jgi:carbon-monoxide dehydrogenase medium subunit